MNTVTWDRIEATLDRAAALSEENEKGLKELKESVAATGAAVAELKDSINDMSCSVKDSGKNMEKSVAELRNSINDMSRSVKDSGKNMEKSVAELRNSINDMSCSLKASGKNMEKSVAELRNSINDMSCSLKASGKNMEKSVAELTDSIKGVNSEVKGIAKSNKMISEDYFYDSLRKSKTLGGIHFDLVEQDMKGAQKQPDGSKLVGQYDVVMINDTAVCLVEVKWRARKENIWEIADRDADAFRTLFPRYENYQVYLAIAGMTFEKDVIDTAKELGMGILTFNGDAVEIHDKNLKAY